MKALFSYDKLKEKWHNEAAGRRRRSAAMRTAIVTTLFLCTGQKMVKAF